MPSALNGSQSKEQQILRIALLRELVNLPSKYSTKVSFGRFPCCRHICTQWLQRNVNIPSESQSVKHHEVP